MRKSDNPSSRSRLRRVAALVAGVALAAGGLGSAAAATPDVPAGPTGGTPLPAGVVPPGSHRITLITGDVVHVTDVGGGRQAVTVDPADPAASVQAVQHDGELLVLPQAALGYVAAGVLDQDLFNVTRLVENGYDDASVDATPVIVEYAAAGRQRAASVPGLEIGRPLASIGGAAAQAEHRTAARSWKALTATSSRPGPARSGGGAALAGGIAAVHLDGKVEATLDTSVPWIGAPEAWEAGYTGEGVTVAVLDSGYDDTHPDLAGQVLPESRSFVPGQEVADDPHGHGTHVISTIVGTGAASDGTHRGVAPDATVLAGKVLGDDGFGQESWIIAGMEWAGENADVVSMSLGTREPSDGTDVMSQALGEISRETGTLFVVAAGNSSAPGTVGSPGASPDALTVGSVDDPWDSLSWFSSQGPVFRTGGLKPDIAGPGNDVTAARSADSPGEGPYVRMDGTSMATPHIAGAAAIVLEQHPDYTADELRAVLTSTARDAGLTPYQAGAGVVDVPAALDADVVASGSGDFGMVRWGETPGPVERTVTYTNRGDEPVLVDLAATLQDTTPGGTGGGGGGPVPLWADGSTPAGLGLPTAAAETAEVAASDVPTGLLTLDAEHLTIPAGGSAAVTATVDPGLLAPGTQVSGALVASVGGEPVARTALGVVREAELYDLTITATGFDGQPTATTAFLWNSTTGALGAVPVDGTTTLRAAPGVYSVMSFLQVPRTPDTLAGVLVGDPGFTLDASRTVALDARSASPVRLDLGKRGEGLAPQFRRMDYTTVGGHSGSYLASVLVDELWAQPQQEDEFDFTTRWRTIPATIQVDRLGGDALDVIAQVGSPALDGKLQAKAADGGAGTPAELAGVGGRIAVVTRSADLTPYQQATNAAAAGARMVLLVNDADGEASTWVGSDDFETETAIPVVGVSGVEGRALLEQLDSRNVVLRAEGDLLPDEVYDLVYYADGVIPDDPTYRPGLARIDTRYGGHAGALAGEFRYDFAPGVEVGLGFPFYAALGAERTEWVSTDDVEWYQDVTQLESGWQMRGVRKAFQPGSVQEESYFGPVVRPYVGSGYFAPYRAGDFGQINLPSAADGASPQHTGAFDVFSGSPSAGSQYTEVYVDGELKGSGPFQGAAVWDLPWGESSWRITNTTEHDGSFLASSTSTSSEWTFSSQAEEGDRSYQALPLLQAYYDVDVDAAGRAGVGRRGGTSVPVGVEVGHVAGAVGTAPVSGATLEVRVGDGEWQPVSLTAAAPGPEAGPSDYEHTGTLLFSPGREYVAGWTAQLRVPDAGGWVSLRVTAEDTAGGTFTQTVERAFEVAPARGTR